jgi:hypothetical protein
MRKLGKWGFARFPTFLNANAVEEEASEIGLCPISHFLERERCVGAGGAEKARERVGLLPS